MPETEIIQAASQRPSVRHRWPEGVLGLLAYLVDHCVYRFQYPVSWHDIRACEESSSAIIVSANGGVAVFDDVEIDILRGLVHGEADRMLAERLGMRPYCIADVRATLRRDLGISTAAHLAQLASDYDALLKC